MKHIIVSILDKAVESFGRPFVARTDNDAMRTVAMEVNRAAPDNMLNTHPQDYALYRVGEWDDETGNVEGQRPERICEARALVKDPQ